MVKMPLPALVRPPAPEMLPPKEEARLLVLPTVSVLEPRLTVPPEPFRAPSVWLAPTLKVVPVDIVRLASVPSAVALLELSVPALRLRVVPVTMLVAAVPSVRTPAPVFVREPPIPLIEPETVVSSPLEPVVRLLEPRI